MTTNKVVVLRYGHRPIRDQRVTSHCCLVARALGAERVLIEGEPDSELVRSIEGVNNAWGQGPVPEFVPHWRPALKELQATGHKVVHLTMYGLPLGKEIPAIRKHPKLCVIIGSRKVEREVYEAADYNVAIGSTPHSEIAALAIFLHELFQGKELERPFGRAKLAIEPSAHGKAVKRLL